MSNWVRWRKGYGYFLGQLWSWYLRENTLRSLGISSRMRCAYARAEKSKIRRLERRRKYGHPPRRQRCLVALWIVQQRGLSPSRYHATRNFVGWNATHSCKRYQCQCNLLWCLINASWCASLRVRHRSRIIGCPNHHKGWGDCHCYCTDDHVDYRYLWSWYCSPYQARHYG
jgi:hypothetical protein